MGAIDSSTDCDPAQRGSGTSISPVLQQHCGSMAAPGISTQNTASLQMAEVSDPRGDVEVVKEGKEVALEASPAPKPRPTLKQCFSKAATWCHAMFIKHFLVISLTSGVIFALAYPVPGKAAASVKVLNGVGVIQSLNTMIIFFISGICLNTKDVKRAWQHKWSVAYGFASILALSPCLGFAMIRIPLEPIEFSMGLAIMCVVPTTLGQGVALVRMCKGNEAVALILLIITNMIGCVTAPAILKLVFMGVNMDGMSFSVDFGPLLVKLLVTILAPAVVGKLLRDFAPPAQRFADRWKQYLGMFSTLNVACMAWMSMSGAREELFQQKASMIVSVIALGAAVYIFYLAFNYLIVWSGFHTEIEEAISVIIMSSQKSAAFAISLIGNTTSDPTVNGLLVIPAVVVQLVQCFLAAVMAPPIADQVDKKHALDEAQAEAAQQQHEQATQLSAVEVVGAPTTMLTMVASTSEWPAVGVDVAAEGPQAEEASEESQAAALEGPAVPQQQQQQQQQWGGKL